MRALAGIIFLVATGSAACAAIGGLDSYTEDAGDEGPFTPLHPHDAGIDHSVSPGDDAGEGDEATGDEATTEAGDEGADEAGDDAGSGTDGALGASDAESYDAAPDAPPPCTTASCPGCCTSAGVCAGGQSTGTCGSGGGACKSCSGSTPDCSGGSCVAAPKDAGTAPPPTCTQSKCGSCGVVQSPCCKSDQTCGCAYYWSLGSCN